MTIIELTTIPIGIPIAFETTGIVVKGTGKRESSAVVNDIPVRESYDYIVRMLRYKS